MHKFAVSEMGGRVRYSKLLEASPGRGCVGQRPLRQDGVRVVLLEIPPVNAIEGRA